MPLADRCVGYPQEVLAFRSELHRTYVSTVERGIRNPTVLIVGKIAAALGVRPVLLLDDYADKIDDVVLGADSEK